MRKREMFLRALQRLLLGDRNPTGTEERTEQSPSIQSSQPAEGSAVPLASAPSQQLVHRTIQAAPAPPAMQKSEAHAVQLMPSPSAEQFPELEEEIKDLLSSSEWDEINQGLELMASTLESELLQTFTSLVDLGSLRAVSPDLWTSVLGIAPAHEVNAVAKIGELTGTLQQLRSIRLNRAMFADEIELDLSLLTSATCLEELIINGGSITGSSALQSLTRLRRLVLVADSVDWDPEEQTNLFSDLSDLQGLTICEWPWEDLHPLAALNDLHRLELRGGELSTLDGIGHLSELTSLTLRDLHSLSSIAEIESLKKLKRLCLQSITVSSVVELNGLENLEALDLESSDLVDLEGLSNLPKLSVVNLGSSELVGLGALASCSTLHQVKLADIPSYSYGDSDRQSFGRRELDRLCVSWKDVHRRPGKVSSIFSKDADIAVVLLGINVMEALSGQIDIKDFQSRLDCLFARWGTELRSRAYWPRCGHGENRYSSTAPIGQWLNRAATTVSTEIIDSIATALAGKLPNAPQRPSEA